MSEVVSLLKSLIRIPSVSRQEKDIADFLEAYVQAAGLNVERIGDNVLFHLGDGPHTLLLATHLDTVPPPSRALYPPFDAVEAEGRIYGRGAVDAKGCVATMTQAVIDLYREGYTPPGRVTVACTVGEEIGGTYNGMAYLVEHGYLQPHAALIGEPTSLMPCIAQKGLLILKVTMHGQACHAARSPEDTAITRAAEAILCLRDISWERSDPLVGYPRVTVTQMEAKGGSRNVVPDTCSFWLDIRSTPAYTHDELIRLIAQIVGEGGDIHIHSKRLVPVRTPAEHPIVQACLQASPGSQPVGSPTLSDWVFLAHVPAVKIGPGDSECSHTDNEYITREELSSGVSLYKRIIRQYFTSIA